MNELEEAFLDVLERYRGEAPFVAVRVRDIRDMLGEKFIGEGIYRTSELTAAVASLIRKYRAMDRLQRIDSGLYEYALDPIYLLERFDELQGRIQGDGYTAFRPDGPVMFEEEPALRLREIADQHFSSVAQLASSTTFLVVRGLRSIDLAAMNELSF